MTIDLLSVHCSSTTCSLKLLPKEKRPLPISEISSKLGIWLLSQMFRVSLHPCLLCSLCSSSPFPASLSFENMAIAYAPHSYMTTKSSSSKEALAPTERKIFSLYHVCNSWPRSYHLMAVMRLQQCIVSERLPSSTSTSSWECARITATKPKALKDAQSGRLPLGICLPTSDCKALPQR